MQSLLKFKSTWIYQKNLITKITMNNIIYIEGS